jgi:hypothetical protein
MRTLLVGLLAALFLACDDTKPSITTTDAETPIDPNTATITLGRTMIGELVQPGQHLLRVIQSPPESGEERGLVCFVYFERAIGSEYIVWNPNTLRTVVYHSNGLVEIVPSGRASYWDGFFEPPFCKAGRDDYRKKLVRHDLLNPPAQKVGVLPKKSR